MSERKSRKKLINQLTKEVLPDVSEQIKGIIEKERRALSGALEKAIKQCKKEEAHTVLQDFLKDIGWDEWPLKDEWITPLRKSSRLLPEISELAQSEARFTVLNTDSFYVQVAKIAKKAARNVQQAQQSLANRFRRSPRSFQEWTQYVPTGRIAFFHLLELQQLVDIWNRDRNKFLAELFHTLDRWSLGQEKTAENEKTKAGEGSFAPEELEQVFENALMELDGLVQSKQEKMSELLESIRADIQHDWELTGTFEQSNELYSPERLAQKEERYTAMLDEKNKQWQQLVSALRQEALVSLNFMETQKEVEQAKKALSENIRAYFDDQLLKLLRRLAEQLDESSNKLASIPEKDKLPAKLANQLKKSLIGHIDELLEVIEDGREERPLSARLEEHTEWLIRRSGKIPEEGVLIQNMKIDEHPPEYSVERINWQALVRRMLNDKTIKELLPEKITPEQILDQLYEEVSDLRQIVEINLEVADEVTNMDEEQSITVAQEGLKRSYSKTEELVELIKSHKEELLNRISDRHSEAFDKLIKLLLSQDISEVKWVGAQYQAREKAVDWQTGFSVFYAKMIDKIELFARFFAKKLKYYFRIGGRFFGFQQKPEIEEEKADLATYLSQTDEKIKGLPFIYRKLFDFKAEVDSRFYIRRTEQFERFKKAYNLWQNNFPSALAVIGEKGSGKSSFWELVKEEILTGHQLVVVKFHKTCWTEAEVVEKITSALKIDAVSSTEELITKIQNKRKRIVVILEDVQNCYVRNINGYEGIERLLYLISETNTKILWGVSCSRYAWNFLDKVLNMADYFTHIAQTDQLDVDQIKSLILKRHKSSGYRLQFIADAGTQRSRSFRKLMDDEESSQEYLQEQYFERLAKVADGNASIAIILWIRSIKDFDETHFYIEPFYSEAIQRIDNLEAPELFTCAAMILHDMLTPKQLSMVLNESLEDSKVMISRQVARSIFVEQENGYMLNQLIYRQILNVLKERNLIH